MKKFIVTGASGFIGTHLVSKLSSMGHFVYAVVQNDKSKTEKLKELKNIEIVQCQNDVIENLADFIDGEIECFIHTAWQGNSGNGRQDFLLQNSNVVSMVKAYRLCEKINCKKFLGLGTISEKIVENIDENRKICTQNLLYGYSKNSARIACEIISRASKTKFIWARLSNIYGIGNETGNILSYTLNNILNNQFACFSSASQIYDLLYIDDCIDALILLANGNPQKSLYFIGSGKPQILRTYLEQVGDVAKKSEFLKFGAREEDNITFEADWMNTEDMFNEFSYSAKMDFETGLITTINYLRGIK